MKPKRTRISEQPEVSRRACLIAVGGAKGGVGKSIFASNLGVHLAAQGHRTVVVDLDLGGANQHLYLGYRSLLSSTMNDFLSNRARTLEEVTVLTRYGPRLIGGNSSELGASNVSFGRKLKMLRAIRHIDADYVILDLGGDTSYNIVDCYNLADFGVVVTTRESASYVGAYQFIKVALYRKLQRAFGPESRFSGRRDVALERILGRATSPEGANGRSINDLIADVRAQAPDSLTLLFEILDDFRPFLVTNRLPQGFDPSGLVSSLQGIMRRWLAKDVVHLGSVSAQREIEASAIDLVPVVSKFPSGVMAQELGAITQRLREQDRRDEPFAQEPLLLDVSDLTEEELAGDAATMDGGAMDGAPIDGGAMDGAAMDSGAMDGAAMDGAAMDSGAMDSGAMDSGAMDSGAMDGAPMDGAPMDGAPMDGAPMDGAPMDGAPVSEEAARAADAVVSLDMSEGARVELSGELGSSLASAASEADRAPGEGGLADAVGEATSAPATNTSESSAESCAAPDELAHAVIDGRAANDEAGGEHAIEEVNPSLAGSSNAGDGSDWRVHDASAESTAAQVAQDGAGDLAASDSPPAPMGEPRRGPPPLPVEDSAVSPDRASASFDDDFPVDTTPFEPVQGAEFEPRRQALGKRGQKRAAPRRGSAGTPAKSGKAARDASAGKSNQSPTTKKARKPAKSRSSRAKLLAADAAGPLVDPGAAPPARYWRLGSHGPAQRGGVGALEHDGGHGERSVAQVLAEPVAVPHVPVAPAIVAALHEPLDMSRPPRPSRSAPVGVTARAGQRLGPGVGIAPGSPAPQASAKPSNGAPTGGSAAGASRSNRPSGSDELEWTEGLDFAELVWAGDGSSKASVPRTGIGTPGIRR